MKLILAVSACLLFSAATFAQNKTRVSPLGSTRINRTAIGGVIKDARKRPMPKVQAYVYRNDTIIASGYTTVDGIYETSSVMPGVYGLRLVYPSSGIRFNITGVPVKSLRVTQVSITCNEPTADTTVAYTDLYPQPVRKR